MIAKKVLAYQQAGTPFLALFLLQVRNSKSKWSYVKI